VGAAEGMSPDAVLYDVSDRDQIQVTVLPAEVEVNRHRASIERQIEGYGAFLGVPFLFTSYRNATRYMGFGPEEAMYVLVRVDKGYSNGGCAADLRERVPEVDVSQHGTNFRTKARTTGR